MKISKFKFNRDDSVNGVWFNGPDGLRLLIARANNVRYRDFMDAQMRPLVRSTRDKALDEDAAKAELTRIDAKAHALYVLRGWENLQDEDGHDVPFSPETAETYFNEMPDFLQLVKSYSLDLDAFRSAGQADSRGN